MKNKAYIKKLAAYAVVLSMSVAALSGCKSEKNNETTAETSTQTDASKDGKTDATASKTKVMVIGDEDIYLDELTVYLFQNIYLKGKTAEEWSENDDIAAKKEVLSSIRETKILYKVAKDNAVELNDSDRDTIEMTSINYIKTFGTELLASYGVSEELVKKVFEEQATVQKFENDIKNDMGQKITADLEKEYKDMSFNSIYYMVFPTIEKDANGDPAVDADGNYISMTDEEKAAVMEDAKKALEELRGGANYKEVADKYKITDYCYETSGYIGGYSDDLNEKLEGLKTGECTDIFEQEKGYSVVYMVSADDESLKTNYVYLISKDYTDDQYEILRNNWLATVEIDEVNDMEGTVWDDYSLDSIVTDILK